MMAVFKITFLRVGDALSQLLNVLLYWNTGRPNHSISGDAYRFNRHYTRKTIDWLFSVYEQEHCYKSYMNEVTKAKELLDEHNQRT